MTTRREEINALVLARHFLMDLMDPQKTPKVPKYVRDEARARLKHYPLMVAELLAAGPHDHEDEEMGDLNSVFIVDRLQRIIDTADERELDETEVRVMRDAIDEIQRLRNVILDELSARDQELGLQ